MGGSQWRSWIQFGPTTPLKRQNTAPLAPLRASHILDCPAAPSGETRGVRVLGPLFFGRYRGSDDPLPHLTPGVRWGHLPPTWGVSGEGRDLNFFGGSDFGRPRCETRGVRVLGPPPSKGPRPGGAGPGGSPRRPLAGVTGQACLPMAPPWAVAAQFFPFKKNVLQKRIKKTLVFYLFFAPQVPEVFWFWGLFF